MDDQQFWSRVDMSGDCWLWNGPVRGYGAGKVAISDDAGSPRSVSAHRFDWELAHGLTPDGMKVVQTCGNPLCIRHLRLSPSRLTKVQARHAGQPFPDRPALLPDIKWSLFERHARDFESYDALASETQMPLTTVRTIIERVSMRTLQASPVPEHRPVSERPAGITDRDWSIYCRHVHDGESQAAIGRDLGISRERVRQIVRSIDG